MPIYNRRLAYEARRIGGVLYEIRRAESRAAGIIDETNYRRRQMHGVHKITMIDTNVVGVIEGRISDLSYGLENRIKGLAYFPYKRTVYEREVHGKSIVYAHKLRAQTYINGVTEDLDEYGQ